MRLDYNSAEALAPVIEALVFASDEPLSAQELRSLILGEEIQKTAIEEPAESASAAVVDAKPEEGDDAAPTDGSLAEVAPVEIAAGATRQSEVKTRKRKSPIELAVIHKAVQTLNDIYLDQSRSFKIVEIAGGYQFATRGEYADYVARLFKDKSRRRLSGAALETLAIVAYKQPVSKLDVENIRGVNCDEVMKSLLEKNLVTITGRAEAVGRPLLYGTTSDFLRHFGLPEIADLPKPREIEELMKEESIRATTLDEAAEEFVTPASEEHRTLQEISSIIEEYPGPRGSLESHLDSREEVLEGIELDVEALQNRGDEFEMANG